MNKEIGNTEELQEISIVETIKKARKTITNKNITSVAIIAYSIRRPLYV